jgi:tetratricopeptide (TPR) repeat protein
MKPYLRYIIIAAIIIVIVGVSSAVAIILSNQSVTNDANNKKDTSSDQAQSPQTKQAQTKANDAEKIAYSGNVNGSVAALDEAIKNTNDNHSKFIYYSQKALILYNNKQLDEALIAAKKAFELEQKQDAAAFVGQIARDKGDKATAIEYYKKAIELVDTGGSPMAEKDKKYYQDIVTTLESGR